MQGAILVLTVPLSSATWKRFIMRTMVAFWEGDARQTTTPLHMLASSASSGSKSVPRMRLRVRPSTTISGEWPCSAGRLVSADMRQHQRSAGCLPAHYAASQHTSDSALFWWGSLPGVITRKCEVLGSGAAY